MGGVQEGKPAPVSCLTLPLIRLVGGGEKLPSFPLTH